MADLNFQPLIEYLDVKFADTDERFDRIETRLTGLETAVSNLAKLVQDFRDEHEVLHHRLEVLEKWAKKVSAKTGIPLPY